MSAGGLILGLLVFGAGLTIYLSRFVAPVDAAPGSFAVYQEATGGESITTTATNITWDTTTIAGAGFALQGNTFDVRLTQAGHYLVIYNIGFATSSGTGRSEIQARIDQNGTDLPVGRSTCYFTRTDGVDDCTVSGSAVIETSGASHDVHIEAQRTDDNTAGVTRQGGSIQLLRLDDSWDFARYNEAGGGQSITSTTFGSVDLDTNAEQDANFSRSGNTVTITAAGNYLVTYNVHMVNTSGGRRGNDFRLTLGGTEIVGSRASAYYFASDSSNDHVASWVGIVSASASDTLVLEGRCNAESCGSTAAVGGAVGITIAALPSGADYVRLHENGGGQAVDGTDDPILWDTEDEEDTGSFSHDTGSNTSRINIDRNGNYLFLGSFYMDRSPLTGTTRMQPSWTWRANGTTTFSYGGFDKFNRGDTGSTGVGPSGAAGGLIAYDLDDADYIELLNTDLSTTTDGNATFQADRYAVQGVNLVTLFEGSATVSSRGTQTASTLPSTTDFYVGGQFVIEETGGGSRNVTDITITETGTIDAQNGLDNIRLYQELDTSNPYDCASESYAGTETQFGSTDTDGFSGANGTSSFTQAASPPTITTTATLCVYVVLDVLAGTAGDDIEIQITDPTVDVTVSAGTVGPGGVIPITGTTNVDGKELRQMHAHWRNDDGDESGVGAATSATGGNEDQYLRIDESTRYRVRIEVSNEGTLDSDGEEFRLEYGELGYFATDCAAYGGSWTAVDAAGGHWDDSNSTFITDENNTTNIAEAIGGVTDEGTFFSVAGTLQDVDSETPTITIDTGEMIEIEYSIEALAAATNGSMYCFRVTDAGTPLDFYDIYPRVVISTANDFHVQRGTTTITSGNTTAIITAGEDYFPPQSVARAFIRITNTSSTGAGRDTDDDADQVASEVTAYVASPGSLLSSVSFSRAGSGNNTRITWEIVEYTGPSGGVNEFIVRNQGSVSYAGAGTTVSQVVNGVVTDADLVPWITGQRNPNTTAAEYDTTLSTTAWDSANDEIDFTRGNASGNAVTVSWAAVEFTGVNWVVQRLAHTYTAAGSTETETPTSNFGATGRVFLHDQKRVNGQAGVDEFGHNVWVSATNEVSFLLESGASTPGNHVSVAWAIENTQTTGTPMAVTRSNGTITSGGTEPRANTISIGTTLADPSVASISVNLKSAGTGTTYTDPIAAAIITADDEYELWVSETSNSKTYRTEVVAWPTAVQIFNQNYYRWYVHNNAINPVDPWPVGGTDLAENTAIGIGDIPPVPTDVMRIRMTVQMTGQILTASERQFKLQFGQRITTCAAIAGGSWNDVGAIGSGSIWRGFNATPADGATLTRILSVSDVNETYEEANNTATNPNAIPVNDDGEWDWVIENNGATANTVYCFRMVHSAGTVFANYNNYPTSITSDFRLESRNWRWYDDENSETPPEPSALAAENTAPLNLAYNNTVKLRFTVAETGGVAGVNTKLRLQFSEVPDFSDGGTFAAEIGGCTEGASLWCYGNGVDTDDAVITTRVLGDSTADGRHNETGTAASTFDPAAFTATEYEFTIRHSGARAGAVYYFRAYDQTNGAVVPLDSGETYPSVGTESTELTFTAAGLASGTVTEGVTTDVTTTPSTIDFGLLNFDQQTEAAHRFTVDTNATEGYQLFVFEDQQLTNGMGGLVDQVTGTNAVPSAWAAGCTGAVPSCYGYHAGDNVLEGGSTRFTANDTYAQFSTTMEEIAYNGGPVVAEANDLIVKMLARLDEDDGSYSNTLTYIAVERF